MKKFLIDMERGTPNTNDPVSKQDPDIDEGGLNPETKENIDTSKPAYYDPNDWTFVGGVLKPYEDIYGEDSWAREEERTLQIFSEILHAEVPRDGILIDAGCGMGRLSIRFASMVGQVVAVEPDNRRLQEAVKAVIDNELAGKIDFRNETIQDMTVENANVALLSHVIQHVPLESIGPILTKLNRCLVNDGLLLLSTNSTGDESDKYTKLYWDGQNNIEKEIDEAEFTQLQNNSDGILPIHWFSNRSLTDLLSEHGFDVQDIQLYHDGRDVQIIARKKSN